ncbi:MAG: hypothetical protein IJO81_05300 [Clostridia bacterium]|nr:hypothetical protein [Clostridia bacterium]
MKKNVFLSQLAGFVFVSVAGVLLHFLYDVSGASPIAAVFSGVNESTWEHMKLLYFPMLFYALLQNRYLDGRMENFWCVKLKGTLLGLTMIPVLFYTIRGVFGDTPDWVNISIFFVAAAVAFYYETETFKKDMGKCRGKSALLLLLAVGVLFAVFTFFTPEIPLFRDPVTGGYGRG